MSAPATIRYVPADPVRDHLESLRDHRVGLTDVARLTGIGRGTLTDLMLGPRDRDNVRGPLATTIATDVAGLIMAVQRDGTLNGRVPGYTSKGLPRPAGTRAPQPPTQRTYPFLADALDGADLEALAGGSCVPIGDLRDVAAGRPVTRDVAVRVNVAVVNARTATRTVAVSGGWGHRMIGEVTRKHGR